MPQPQWPALCDLILSFRSAQPPLLPPDPSLLRIAQQLSERLSLSGLPDSSSSDLALVHLNSIDHRFVRSVGGERLALHALQSLRFADTLGTLGASRRDASIATALVIARMLHPSSEREAHAWLTQQSATLELLGLEPGQPLSLSKLYRTGDLLWRHREALETALFHRERTLLDLPKTIVFYDLTNVHYHRRPRGDLLRHGRSKQNAPSAVMRPPMCNLRNSKGRAGFGGA